MGGRYRVAGNRLTRPGIVIDQEPSSILDGTADVWIPTRPQGAPFNETASQNSDNQGLKEALQAPETALDIISRQLGNLVGLDIDYKRRQILGSLLLVRTNFEDEVTGIGATFRMGGQWASPQLTGTVWGSTH